VKNLLPGEAINRTKCLQFRKQLVSKIYAYLTQNVFINEAIYHYISYTRTIQLNAVNNLKFSQVVEV